MKNSNLKLEMFESFRKKLHAMSQICEFGEVFQYSCIMNPSIALSSLTELLISIGFYEENYIVGYIDSLA